MPGVLVRILAIVPELIVGGKLEYVLMNLDGGSSAMGLCIPHQEKSPENIMFTGQGELHSFRSDLWTVWCAYEIHLCQIVNHTTLSAKTRKTNVAGLWPGISRSGGSMKVGS